MAPEPSPLRRPAELLLRAHAAHLDHTAGAEEWQPVRLAEAIASVASPPPAEPAKKTAPRRRRTK